MLKESKYSNISVKTKKNSLSKAKKSIKNNFYFVYKNKLICPIVNIDIQLIGRDDVIIHKSNLETFNNEDGIPNRDKPGNKPFSKLSSDNYNRVKKKAFKTLQTELNSISDFLYYGCDEINGMTHIKKPIMKENPKGNFIFSFQVCYSLNKPITFKQLKKKVGEIFDHWRWSGDIAYKLISFNLKKSSQFLNI